MISLLAFCFLLSTLFPPDPPAAKRRMKVINLRSVSRMSLYAASGRLRAAVQHPSSNTKSQRSLNRSLHLCPPLQPLQLPDNLPPTRPRLPLQGSDRSVCARVCGHGGKNTLDCKSPPPPPPPPSFLAWTAEPGSSAPERKYLRVGTCVVFWGLVTASPWEGRGPGLEWEEKTHVNLLSGRRPPLSADHLQPIH